MSKERAAELYNEIKGLSAIEILDVIAGRFDGKIRFASSMGAEDQVITKMLTEIQAPVEIFTLDTGRMFAETYELIEKTQARYNINIKIYFPQSDNVEQMVNEKGINLFYHSIENRKLCCGVRKIEPLKRALQGLDAWITGLRREQSLTRAEMLPVEWDESTGLIKVNPLFDWSEQRIWEYIKEYRIPYNTLHDKMYPSIGCQPCTQAVAPGDDVRMGRWWWENPETKECGLHNKLKK
jgi:phosphoadenosine phosphosulfate reductase